MGLYFCWNSGNILGMVFPEYIEQKIKSLLDREKQRYTLMGLSEFEVDYAAAPVETFLRICVENMVEDGLDWETIEKRIT